jgi:hypothetical protein
VGESEDRGKGGDGWLGVGSISILATALRAHPRFNFFTTKRVLRVGQYDGIDDFVAFDLGGEKRLLVQFLVGEFHSSAICKRFNPLVAHSAPPSGDSVEIIRALRLKMYESSRMALGTLLSKSHYKRAPLLE